jgi:hypothetical protein
MKWVEMRWTEMRWGDSYTTYAGAIFESPTLKSVIVELVLILRSNNSLGFGLGVIYA